MNNLKLVMPILAIAIGSVGAWASRPSQDCTLVTQFYYDGSSYHAAGTLGKDYICVTGTTICTYFAAGNSYQACQSGTYTPFHATPPKKN